MNTVTTHTARAEAEMARIFAALAKLAATGQNRVAEATAADIAPLADMAADLERLVSQHVPT